MSIKRRFDVSLIAEIGAQGKTGPAELPAVALSEENRRSKFSTKDRELGRSERMPLGERGGVVELKQPCPRQPSSVQRSGELSRLGLYGTGGPSSVACEQQPRSDLSARQARPW